MSEYTANTIHAEIKHQGEWLSVAWAGEHLLPTTPAKGYCPECDTHLDAMSLEDRDYHTVRGGQVMIACEGYYTPAFVAAFARWMHGEDAVVVFHEDQRESIDAVYPGEQF